MVKLWFDRIQLIWWNFKELTMVWQGSKSLMAWFSLLITAWRKYTEENSVIPELEWFTQISKIQRVRKTLQLTNVSLVSIQNVIKVAKVKSKLLILQSYMLYQSLTKDLLLAKGLSSSMCSPERHLRARGDQHHTAMLLSRERSKKAHLPYLWNKVVVL